MAEGTDEAAALWIEEAGRAAFRRSRLPAPAPGDCRVRSLHGAVSRGTERLVFAGRVPPEVGDAMRAPFQEGEFGFPLKYGYCLVGTVEEGPDALLGRTVFCLHPHQDRIVAPAEALRLVPDDVTPAQAVLAANMETALNVVWDAAIQPGDRVAVVGAGLVGALVAYLAARIAGTEVTLLDVEPGRARLAAALGVAFAPAAEPPADCDVAVNASGTGAGLDTALAALGFEGRAVEASWHGDAPATLALGGMFHARRLRIVASQVGALPAGRRGRWSAARRLDLALRLLADPALDALISGASPFATLDRDYAAILNAPGTLCHRIDY